MLKVNIFNYFIHFNIIIIKLSNNSDESLVNGIENRYMRRKHLLVINISRPD